METVAAAKNEMRGMIGGYIFLLPLLTQAYLLHPSYEKWGKARLMRLALMPISIYLCLTRLHLRLFYPLDVFFHWNFAAICFPTFHSVCLAIQYGLFNGSVFASKKFLVNNGNYRGEDDEQEEEKSKYLISVKTNPTFLEKIKFTIWLIYSPRGLETSWAPSLEVVPQGPQYSIGKFFLFTLFKTLICHFISTLLWTIAVACIQHPYKTYGFWADLFPPLGFLKKFSQTDFFIPATLGGTAWFMIDTLGGVMTLLEVIVYAIGPYILPKDLSPGKFDSRRYPPLFNDIVSRESLIAFWSKGWHAIFRRNIIFCGWNPLEFIFSIFGKDAGKMAGMLGAMIFSGIFHEYVIAATSHMDPNFRTIKMFAFCGLGMIAEVQFKRRTGRLVKGIPGRLWTGLVLAAYGHAMTQSWIDRGLGRNGIPPPRLWTWHRFVLPFSALFPERWISSLNH